MDKRTLPQKMADLLKTEIENGTFSPSEKLPNESELMKKYGVGRSTVREAMKLLSFSGVVKIKQGVGTFIDSSSIKHTEYLMLLKEADAAELDELRSILAPSILLNLDKDLEDIENIVTEVKKYEKAVLAKDIFACNIADMKIRTTLATYCSNRLLSQIYIGTLSTPERKNCSQEHKLEYWSTRYQKFEELIAILSLEKNKANKNVPASLRHLLE